MKRFKELRESLLIESEFSAYGDGGESIAPDGSVSQFASEDNLGRINAFINNFLADETLHPKARLEQLRVRLNQIGLDFDSNKGIASSEDTKVYAVEYFGQGYGYHPTTGEIGSFDYGTAKLGKALQLEVTMVGSGVVSMNASLGFAGESTDEDLVGEALDLYLRIENDDELFESKLQPALDDIDILDEEGLDRAFRGLIYGVRAAAKKYDLDLDENTLEDVALSILESVIEPEDEDEEEFEVEVEIESLDDAEELDELKMPKTNKYGEYTSRKVRDATMAGSSRAGERARKQDNKDYAAYLSGKKPDGGKARRHNDRSINRLNRLVNTKARDAEKREKDRAAAEKGREKVGAGKRRRG